MNSKNKTALQTILIAVFFFFALLIWTIWQFHFNYMISLYDTFFHAERIYEIRLAFQQHTLPSWVNFNTFYNAGQAINGMYPDFTLWPFVLVTNFLTPIHQIIAIRALITGAVFVVSFLSLNKRFDSKSAILAATVFTLSGAVIKDLMNEMQIGTAIIMIFAFPLIFTFKDAIESKKIEPHLIIKVALLMTIVINSHLISAVVITIIAGIFLVVGSIVKRTFYPWMNLIAGGLLTIILCLPIIYRIVKISKTGLLSPFGLGKVTSPNLWNFFSETAWNAKSNFSITAILLIIITLIGFKKDKLKQLLPWISVELVIMLFCTNIVPWNLLEHLPILNSFQVSNWRFAPFLGIIPLIMVLINFDKRKTHIIFLIMAILSYGMAIQTAYSAQNFHKSQQVQVTANTTQKVGPNATVKLSSDGINSDMLTRTLIPDYAPNSTPIDKKSNGASLDSQLIYLLSNHLAYTNDRDIPMHHFSTINGITLTGQNIPKGELNLPVYGYNTLNYLVTLNGKPAHWWINSSGFITVHSNQTLRKATYKVTQVQPRIYPSLIWMSFVLYLALIGVLFTPIVNFKR